MEVSKQYHGNMQAAVEVTSRSIEHAGKQQIMVTELWKQANSRFMSGSYPAAVQAVVQKIQAVVLKPSKIMLTCSWA